MSLSDHNRVAETIINWISTNAKNIGNPYIVIGLSGDVSSSLTAILCKRVNIPVIGVCIDYGEPSDSWASANCKSFCSENNIQLVKISAKELATGIYGSIESSITNAGIIIHKKYLLENISNSIISANAVIFGGSVVSPMDKNKSGFVRKINRIFCNADLYPIADLYKSEVLELYKFITDNIDGHPVTKSIANKELSDEDIGISISHNDIEWADKENVKSKAAHFGIGIIECVGGPSNHRSRFWIGYNSHQKEIIAKLNGIYGNIKHTNTQLNICKLRESAGLIA